jgi:iron complex transport system substrate-binding protein
VAAGLDLGSTSVRIVSLLPSTTEILFAVGAGDDVVGVTFECDFPPEARSRQIVSTSTLPDLLDPAEIDAEVRARMAGGEDLYHLDEGALRDLAPDLVITQDLCAVCAVDVGTVAAALDHLGCHGSVLTVDPGTLDDVLESINRVGSATGRGTAAEHLVGELRSRLARVAAMVAGHPRPRVVMVEWTDPLFCAGHWVPDMIAASGAVCASGEPGRRSHPISPETLVEADPDLIIIAPCGYDLVGATSLAAKLVEEEILPSGVPVWAVDADAAFVRPGPRLVDGIEALAGICHPTILPIRHELAAPVATGSTSIDLRG